MIHTIGIIGSGKMGSDIFNYLSDFDLQLIWFTRNESHRDILRKTYQKKIKRQLKHGVISNEIFELRKEYQISTDLNNLDQCDFIVESVIEELDVKQELFKKLETIIKPSCVLASNSSSILPSELSEDLNHKNRVIGLHFFYPIAFKNVVELIPSEYTDDITIEKAKFFLNKIKRFYLLQDEKSAFVLNRFLLQIQIEAFQILKQRNLGFQQFDDIAKEYIPEFGLFEMMDHVGHNTMYNSILNYSRFDSDKKKYQPLLNELQTRKAVSDQNSKNLFYNNDLNSTVIDEKTKLEIINQLKNIANKHFKYYTQAFSLNQYNFKKGLEEYCGILL